MAGNAGSASGAIEIIFGQSTLGADSAGFADSFYTAYSHNFSNGTEVVDFLLSIAEVTEGFLKFASIETKLIDVAVTTRDLKNIRESYNNGTPVQASDLLSVASTLTNNLGQLAIAGGATIFAPATILGGLLIVGSAAFTLAAINAKKQGYYIDGSDKIRSNIDSLFAISSDPRFGPALDGIRGGLAGGMGGYYGGPNGANNLAGDICPPAMGLPGDKASPDAGSKGLWDRAKQWMPRVDPLAFDLDGDGLEVVAKTASGEAILFDHDGDGVRSGTGWIGPDDGFLAMDRNGNGSIDNGSELFGEYTSLSSGGRASDGFIALADQDSNSDGVIDSSDAAWSDLRIWRDANQDGISQSNELLTMAQAEISGINVERQAHSQTLDNGSQIADLGQFTRTNGAVGEVAAVGQVADINLLSDTFHREFTDSVPLAAGVELLPEMRGSGLVRDLREAASLSPELRATLQQFTLAGSREEQMALLDELLEDWANTSGLHTSLEVNQAGFRGGLNS